MERRWRIFAVAAWVIGARALLKALLLAFLEPIKALRAAEEQGDRTARLALVEASKMLPAGAVWEEFCRRQLVPGEFDWIATVRKYEADVTSARS